MTIDSANRQLISALHSIYDDREAASICSMVLEKVTGMSRSLRLIHRLDELDLCRTLLFQQWLAELMQHRPVQYVLGEAWFGGLPFYVDENVLIPRPETEELIEWILGGLQTPLRPGFCALDIGTGTGCIPIILGKRQKNIRLMACDISGAALDIARKNSMASRVEIEFFLCDIRNPECLEKMPPLNLIISNPPYIPERQKLQLDKHVRLFEPELALFVPDNDPIVFYKLIGQFAKKKLLADGHLFMELHHDFAREIVHWYGENGFSTELRKDLSGKSRMLRAWL